ncbi:hypothetical protein [Lyngbya confervoides]|uniref:POLO box domain-containing protein n=1 Tax=Lyngbya confervoides BDU141951 TaxID=1574623 RepID=A0ABD4T5I1_9CYAN|nr:hypothetical protein [Lyngbya confervoides]MCM1983502.1 hypothetical protein [Lyngbya confervoides BDU141951]
MPFSPCPDPQSGHSPALPWRRTRVFVTLVIIWVLQGCGFRSQPQGQPDRIPPQPPRVDSPRPEPPGSSLTTPQSAETPPAPPLQALADLNQPYDVLDEFGRSQFQVTSAQVFERSGLPNLSVTFSEQDLLTVLRNTRAYFLTYAPQDPKILRPGLLGAQGIEAADILNTLNFMIAVLQEDLAAGRVTRLKDPQFLQQHFQILHWTPFNPGDQQQQELRLTKYAVFTHSGSRRPGAPYDVALYQLEPQAKADQVHRRYSKQEVLAGVFEPGGVDHGQVKPLAYLTRTGLEEALLQGTLLVNFVEGGSAYFNVDVNNGIAYEPGVAQQAQRRYWYFKQVDAIKGYGYTSEAKISVLPGVTFAGDILNIGLGRVVALETQVEGKATLQLGLIADTGGAFSPNLHQLDFLAGVFPSRAAFTDYARSRSGQARAYILVRPQ